MNNKNELIKLKIKNIGPIKDGYTSGDGFMDINGVTLFIGNQGTGKSTVAKVFSTLSWIEKALVRGDFTAQYLSLYKRFNKQFSYQGIGNYFNEKSEIEYIGQAFSIKYSDSTPNISKNREEGNYQFPKIMYIPAERNFISSVDRPDLVKRLPLPLYTFLDEYEEAKRSIGDEIELPVGNVKFSYRKQNKKSILEGKDFKIELLEASSGFQSLVPLFIVTRYLSRLINESGSTTHKEISIDEEQKIRKEIDKIIENEKISDDVKRVLLEKLSARFKYASFLNIVEEPEQNLYPFSQKEILFELLKSKNDHPGNKLMITTHSPYIINYLTLAVKADAVKNKLFEVENNQKNQELLEALSMIVPSESAIPASSISIYQLDDVGSIKKLPDYNGLPSDENYLNEFLAESNDLFIELMEIEDKCQ
ncbi:MAG: ATP-binding protein [Desulfamplus sp.]|nr:ATP-binding protein [Desulfamplus sp.]